MDQRFVHSMHIETFFICLQIKRKKNQTLNRIGKCSMNLLFNQPWGLWFLGRQETFYFINMRGMRGV